MSLNCNELNVILDELRLEGALIQDVAQPCYDMLALRTYRAGAESAAQTVLVCTTAGACRLCATRRRITKNDRPLRFMEFLRSRVRGARIRTCRQLGLERIVRMDLTRGEESLVMYIRLWSGAANVIITDTDGTVLDTMFRRPAKGEVTGGTFIAEERAPSEEESAMSLRKWPVRSFDGAEGETFNQKVDIFYSESAQSLSRTALLAQAEKWFGARRGRMLAALRRLKDKRESFRHADRLLHQGDLILANCHAVKAGDTILECTDYETGQAVSIMLDPGRTAQENAAELYSRYKKAVSGAGQLEHDIAAAQKEISALEAQYAAIKEEQNVVKLEQLLRRSTTPGQRQERPHPGLGYTVSGWRILVGRSASENDELLRRFVRGQDMWLHVRDFSGGYVFIKNRPGKSIPLEILLYAGNLAVYHSKARKNGRADLYCTQVKYLRRAKKGPIGLVIPTQEKNLSITLDRTLLNRLELLQEV